MAPKALRNPRAVADDSLVEAVPPTLQKFHTGKGAVLVRRVECFVPAMPFQTTPNPPPVQRILALGAKGMYLSDPDGTVVRVAVYDEVRRITSCLKYVALEFSGGRDALGICFTPFSENTGNNPEVVLKQLMARCTKVLRHDRIDNLSEIFFCLLATGVPMSAAASNGPLASPASGSGPPAPSITGSFAAASPTSGLSFSDSVSRYIASPSRPAAGVSSISSELQHDLQLPAEQWVSVLENIYAQCNPDKIPQIPRLLQEFKGREVGLVLGIAKKYFIPLDDIVEAVESSLATLQSGVYSPSAPVPRGLNVEDEGSPREPQVDGGAFVSEATPTCTVPPSKAAPASPLVTEAALLHRANEADSSLPRVSPATPGGHPRPQAVVEGDVVPKVVPAAMDNETVTESCANVRPEIRDASEEPAKKVEKRAPSPSLLDAANPAVASSWMRALERAREDLTETWAAAETALNDGPIHDPPTFAAVYSWDLHPGARGLQTSWSHDQIQRLVDQQDAVVDAWMQSRDAAGRSASSRDRSAERAVARESSRDALWEPAATEFRNTSPSPFALRDDGDDDDDSNAAVRRGANTDGSLSIVVPPELQPRSSRLASLDRQKREAARLQPPPLFDDFDTVPDSTRLLQQMSPSTNTSAIVAVGTTSPSTESQRPEGSSSPFPVPVASGRRMSPTSRRSEFSAASRSGNIAGRLFGGGAGHEQPSLSATPSIDRSGEARRTAATPPHWEMRQEPQPPQETTHYQTEVGGYGGGDRNDELAPRDLQRSTMNDASQVFLDSNPVPTVRSRPLAADGMPALRVPSRAPAASVPSWRHEDELDDPEPLEWVAGSFWGDGLDVSPRNDGIRAATALRTTGLMARYFTAASATEGRTLLRPEGATLAAAGTRGAKYSLCGVDEDCSAPHSWWISIEDVIDVALRLLDADDLDPHGAETRRRARLQRFEGWPYSVQWAIFSTLSRMMREEWCVNTFLTHLAKYVGSCFESFVLTVTGPDPSPSLTLNQGAAPATVHKRHIRCPRLLFEGLVVAWDERSTLRLMVTSQYGNLTLDDVAPAFLDFLDAHSAAASSAVGYRDQLVVPPSRRLSNREVATAGKGYETRHRRAQMITDVSLSAEGDTASEAFTELWRRGNVLLRVESLCHSSAPERHATIVGTSSVPLPEWNDAVSQWNFLLHGSRPTDS